MKQYPSIQNFSGELLGKSAIAFDKLDGSNMRFEWDRRKGWTKFGKRSDVITEDEPVLGSALPRFRTKYADQLEKIFKDDKDLNKVQEFVAFAEWVGPGSAFGQHVPGAEMDLVLIDLHVYKKGMLPPRDFVRKFERLGIPEVIFDRILDEHFRDTIRSSRTLAEGAVVKGMENGKPWMAKIKTMEWMRQLRERYGMLALVEDVGRKAALLFSDI